MGIVLYYKGKHLKKNKDYKIVKKEGHKYVIVKEEEVSGKQKKFI